jgi:hypothetical protein
MISHPTVLGLRKRRGPAFHADRRRAAPGGGAVRQAFPELDAQALAERVARFLEFECADVAACKPAPEGYLLAAQALEVEISCFLVRPGGRRERWSRHCEGFPPNCSRYR